MTYYVGAGSKDTVRFAAAEALLKGAGLVANGYRVPTGSLHIIRDKKSYDYGSNSDHEIYKTFVYSKGFFNLDDPQGFYAFAYIISEMITPNKTTWALQSNIATGGKRTATANLSSKTVSVGCAVIGVDVLREMIRAIENPEPAKTYVTGFGSGQAQRVLAATIFLHGLGIVDSDRRPLLNSSGELAMSGARGYHLKRDKRAYYSTYHSAAANADQYEKGFFNLDAADGLTKFMEATVAAFKQGDSGKTWHLYDSDNRPNGYHAIVGANNTIEVRTANTSSILDTTVPLATLKEISEALS